MFDPDKLKDLELDYRKKMGQTVDRPMTSMCWAVSARIIEDLRTKCLKEDK